MLVKDFECRSYEQAKELLGERHIRRVCNNTIVATIMFPDDDGVIVVQLHRHKIVQFHPDGRIILDSCGFRTVTTKSRINKCLPEGIGLSQVKFKWVIWSHIDKFKDIPFVDGMDLDEALEVAK